MFKTFTIDPTPIKEQLMKMIESCMEAALKQTKAALDGAPQSPPLSVKVTHQELAGLRDQIEANAMVLLPILRPETSTAMSRQCMFTPQLHIIVKGGETSSKAFVVYGYHGDAKMTPFIYGDTASTATRALEKLLGVTMRLVSTHVFDDKDYKGAFTTKIKGGGYISAGANDGSNVPAAAMLWPNPLMGAVQSPMFPTGVSFGSYASTDSMSPSERAYLEMRAADGIDDGIGLGLGTPNVTSSFYSIGSNKIGMESTFGTAHKVEGKSGMTLNIPMHSTSTSTVPQYVMSGGSYTNGAGSSGVSGQNRGLSNNGVDATASFMGVDKSQGNSGLGGNNGRKYDGPGSNVQMHGWQ